MKSVTLQPDLMLSVEDKILLRSLKKVLGSMPGVTVIPVKKAKTATKK